MRTMFTDRAVWTWICRGLASKPHGTDAPGFIHHLISQSPGRSAIIALGPLTNIAAALERFPGLASEIGEIVVMGGAVEVEGNITPYAEFNISEDPWAANVVFTCGAPVTLVGLDVTRRTFLRPSDGPEWFRGGSASARLCNRIMARLCSMDRTRRNRSTCTTRWPWQPQSIRTR